MASTQVQLAKVQYLLFLILFMQVEDSRVEKAVEYLPVILLPILLNIK